MSSNNNNPLPSFSTRNVMHSASSSSSSQLSWLNDSPAIEDIQSAMGGLILLSNTVTENTNTVTPNTSDYLPLDESYCSESDEDLDPLLPLHRVRVRDAAAAYSSPYSCYGFCTCCDFAGIGGNSNRVIAPLGRGRGGVRNYNNGINLEQPIRIPTFSSSSSWVIHMASNQCGCRILQRKIDEGTPEMVQYILSQVKDHSLHLMTHPFGNYLIQKIFEANNVNAQQIDMMLDSIVKDEKKLKQVCFNDHGTKAIQQVLKNLRTKWQVALFTCVMRRITVPLLKNINASYIIEELLKTFPMAYKKAIFEEVARNCVAIATDRSGCSSMQRCMVNAPFAEAQMVLLEEIILNAAVLSQDQFGNYVVQYLIKLGVPAMNSMIVSQLGGKYAQLCMNKYGGHVVEDLINYSEERDHAIIIDEIMNTNDFREVLQDPFGNFVVQKALKCVKGNLLKKLVSGILSHSEYLHSHLYGKRVLNCAQVIALCGTDVQ